jgi:hypothetical protein
MKWMLAACFVVAACAQTETARVKRWPTNRQKRDAKMEKIDKQISILIEHVAKLEAEVAALRAGTKPAEPARSDSLTPPSTPATP